MRNLVQILLFVLPWTLRRRALSRLFGFEIAEGARIGFSLVSARRVSLAAGARIGHLTLIKGLSELRLGTEARLGNLNWVTAVPAGNARHFLLETDRCPALVIEDHAAVTHRHLVDCTDRVTIGAFTTFAGWGSQILTHAIDLRANCQSAAPVTVGRYCFVGTRVVLLKGSRLPDRSVLAAGSVLSRAMEAEDTIYGGVPAVAMRTIDPSSGYFERDQGFVF